jgi:hypothetical protein
VNCTVCFPVPHLIAQEWAGLRLFLENAFVPEEMVLVLIDDDCRFLAGVLVIDQKLKLATNFLYRVDLPHVVAALTALLAFKYHEW